MIRITQLRNKCIGCNACVEAFPQRWRISRKDGKSVLVGGRANKSVHFLLTGEDEWEGHSVAAKNCPVRVIRVERC
jgi:ferredoxin